jgi:Mycothiol-dependent nitroreductase Rv2466c
MATADMWVDPMCPWTWLTAQWLLEVERVRDVAVRFHIMSLSVLNEGRAGTAEEQHTVAVGWGPVRVLTATALSFGEPALRSLYVSLATLIHQGRRNRFNRDLYANALTSAGLPHTLANAADSTFYDDAIRADHQAAFGPVADALADGIGCPIIHVGQSTEGEAVFFGPVVSPCPRGEPAGRLWDSVALAAETDSFLGLKRARTRAPAFD